MLIGVYLYQGKGFESKLLGTVERDDNAPTMMLVGDEVILPEVSDRRLVVRKRLFVWSGKERIPSMSISVVYPYEAFA